MKRLLQYFILLQFGFTILSCDWNPVETSKSNSVKYYTVSGLVLDHIYTDVSPGYRVGVPVVLDNDTAITNSDGEYSFNRVTKGNHVISVSLPENKPYLATISVYSNTTYDIHLFGVKQDYFPIQVNTQKRFEYHSCNGFGGVCDTGKALWSIYSLQQRTGEKIYSVKETLIYASTMSEQNPQLDTVINQILIIEDSSNKITFELGLWDGISFDRYLDPRRGEIIELTFYPGPQRKISLKKNVGLYKMEYYDSAHLWSENYELIE